MRFGSHAHVSCPSAMHFPEGRKEKEWEIYPGEDIMIEVAVHGWSIPTEEVLEERRRAEEEYFKAMQEANQQNAAGGEQA